MRSLTPKWSHKSGLDQGESSRGLSVGTSPILEIWGKFQRANPEALARSKSQFLRPLGCALFTALLLSPLLAFSSSFSRVELRHLEPEGIGFDKGYTTVALFLTPQQQMGPYPFVDLRGHVFNDGKLAANAGGGVRIASDRWELVWGANAYYDYRNTQEMSVHQGSVGFEWLSPWYDLRVNGFYPFSGKDSLSSPKFSHFCGCDAFAAQRVRGALPMAEAEVRLPIYPQIDLSVGLGGYYLFSRKVANVRLGNAPGGTLHLLLRPTDGLMFEGGLSFDQIFHVRGNGLVRFSVPFGPGNMRTRGRRFREKFGSRGQELARLTSPVWRTEIIPVETGQRYYPILCPNDKRERKMIFVRGNRYGEEGDGSFENPFASLNNAIKHATDKDILYLITGEESTLTESISLHPHQHLIGSSESMILKEIPIPAISSQMARVRGRGGTPVVRIGEDSTIQGISFDGATLSTENAGNFAIHRCAFNGDKPTLIINGHKKGKKEVTDSLFSGDENALYIAMSDGSDLLITGNRFSGFSRSPIAFADKENRECKVTIRNNEFYDIGAPAILLPEIVTRCAIAITENQFGGISADTILLGGELRESQMRISDNTFSRLSGSALAVGSMVGSIIEFCDNELTQARSAVLLGFTPSPKAENSTLLFSGNELSSIEESGVELSAASQGSIFSLEQNRFGECGSGLVVRAGSEVHNTSFLLKENQFTRLMKEALYAAPPLHKCQVILSDNTLSDLATTDVDLTADHTEVTLENNTFCNEFSMHALGSSSLFLSNNSSPLYRLINEKGEDFFLQPPNPTEFTKTNTGMIQAIGENFLFTASPRKPR